MNEPQDTVRRQDVVGTKIGHFKMRFEYYCQLKRCKTPDVKLLILLAPVLEGIGASLVTVDTNTVSNGGVILVNLREKVKITEILKKNYYTIFSYLKMSNMN